MTPLAFPVNQGTDTFVTAGMSLYINGMAKRWAVFVRNSKGTLPTSFLWKLGETPPTLHIPVIEGTGKTLFISTGGLLSEYKEVTPATILKLELTALRCDPDYVTISRYPWKTVSEILRSTQVQDIWACVTVPPRYPLTHYSLVMGVEDSAYPEVIRAVTDTRTINI